MGSEETTVASQAGEVVCGRPFQLPTASGLRLTGKFPESVSADRQMVRGTVEVTAAKAVRGVAAQNAEAFLVREGRVVTTPLPQDAMGVQWTLAAGESKSVPAPASLVSCEKNGGALPAGDYEIYARFVLAADDGKSAPAYGGPWPLRVE